MLETTLPNLAQFDRVQPRKRYCDRISSRKPTVKPLNCLAHSVLFLLINHWITFFLELRMTGSQDQGFDVPEGDFIT
jgi:hypothetical protein